MCDNCKINLINKTLKTVKPRGQLVVHARVRSYQQVQPASCWRRDQSKVPLSANVNKPQRFIYTKYQRATLQTDGFVHS